MRVSAVLIIASVKHKVAGEADGRDTAMRETCATLGRERRKHQVERERART
jgi:hypothetical protein